MFLKITQNVSFEPAVTSLGIVKRYLVVVVALLVAAAVVVGVVSEEEVEAGVEAGTGVLFEADAARSKAHA